MALVRLVSQLRKSLADVLDRRIAIDGELGCDGGIGGCRLSDGSVYLVGVKYPRSALHVSAVATAGFEDPFVFELSEGSSDGARSQS